MNAERFARILFRVAGIYGLLILAPGYFMEEQVAVDWPPAITHPEYYYGFIGVALAWQVVFLIIAQDPLRYRPLMLAAVLEKLGFAVAAALLFAGGRLAVSMFAFSLVDAMLAVLFAIVYWQTRPRPMPG